MVLIQLSWGWLNAKRARKASSVLVELLSATSHHPPNGRNDYISSCTLSRTATAAPLCQVFQENMAAMLWTGARGVVWMVRASVCARVHDWEGWLAVTHNPAHNTPPQAALSKVSLHLPPPPPPPRPPPLTPTLRDQTEWESQTF